MSLTTLLILLALLAGCGVFVHWVIRSSARMQAELKDFVRRPLTRVIPHQVILPRGETAFIAVRAMLREVVNLGWRAGSAGMSVRVAKGVTIRTGSTRGHAVHDWATVAVGELVITDQRVVYVGDNCSFAYGLDQVIGFTVEGLAKMQIILATTRGHRRLAFPRPMDSHMVKATFEKVLAKKLGRPSPPAGPSIDLSTTRPTPLPSAARRISANSRVSAAAAVRRVPARHAKVDPWLEPPHDGEAR